LITKLIYGQTTSNITYDPGTNIDIGTGADVCADAIIINGTFSGGGTICQGPLPVVISSFTSAVSKNNVTLRWVTESEINNSGFDIEKKEIKENSVWHKTGFVQGSGTTNEQKSYSFEDKKLKTGKFNYRLKQIDYNGNYEYFELESDVVIAAPNVFSISQNYPNPSNPKSKIDYEIRVNGKVTIKLYNLIGQELLTIVNEIKEAGYYTAEFDGKNLASGVYFYRIIAGEFFMVKKLVLVK
jgi:hypothetical protein